MDNQQGRLEDKMIWLGGIIDGEGCVTATAGHTKTGHGNKYEHRRYIPQISIVNTDKLIVDKVISILKEAEIAHYVNERIGSKKNPHWKTKWEITIIGMKRCLNACNKLIPYLHSEKKQRMQYLKEWIEYRLASPKISFSTKGYGGCKKVYTDIDWNLLSLIRQSSLTLRDYTLSSANNADEDIVQSTAKAVEKTVKQLQFLKPSSLQTRALA